MNRFDNNTLHEEHEYESLLKESLGALYESSDACQAAYMVACSLQRRYLVELKKESVLSKRKDLQNKLSIIDNHINLHLAMTSDYAHLKKTLKDLHAEVNFTSKTVMENNNE